MVGYILQNTTTNQFWAGGNTFTPVISRSKIVNVKGTACSLLTRFADAVVVPVFHYPNNPMARGMVTPCWQKRAYFKKHHAEVLQRLAK
jgi:hypothetical protein